MKTYSYQMTGTAAAGQTWRTAGTIELSNAEFSNASAVALLDSFQQLTKGKAVYGKPGVGCEGPYSVTRLLIEEATQ